MRIWSNKMKYIWCKSSNMRYYEVKGGITLRVHLTPDGPRNLIFSQFECKWMRLGISWKKSIFLLSGSPTIMHYMGCVKWSNPGFPVWVSAAHQTQNIEYSHRNTAWHSGQSGGKSMFVVSQKAKTSQFGCIWMRF